MSMAGPIVASAPGKLFLIGEYAVLEGAPAILTAVDRRARVTLTDSADEYWHLTAPNLDIDGLALGVDGRGPAEIDASLADRLRVYRAVLARVVAHIDTPLPPLNVHIDTIDFARDGHKLGLGSSAAVAAALSRALLARAGVEVGHAELAELAIAAHRDAQNGTGSGGDVATAVYGGIIGYTRDTAPTPLAWPPGLSGLVVVTGTGASTTDLVGRVYEYGKREPAGFASDIGRLAALAENAAEDLGQAVRFVRLAREFFEALIALDHHAKAGIVSERHHELHATAARHGAVFKSSGAGGGDVGLLFTTPNVDETALRREFDAAGADIIDLGFAAPGVALENETDSSAAPRATTGERGLR
ncbi:mevalonate kinase family protein [Salinisphaera hydrothermalis]|uniref:mevalonate kinase family protein n=1 Tax=Salinisphaera hydrothermalis TaxID=563188 RepID=UPI003341CC10